MAVPSPGGLWGVQGVGSLQGAYNRSGVAPHIVVDAVRGGVTIQDNVVPIGAPLFVVEDSVGNLLMVVDAAVVDLSGAPTVELPTPVGLPASAVFDVDADAPGFAGNLYFNTTATILSNFFFSSTNGVYPFSFSVSAALAGFQTLLGVPMGFVSASSIAFNANAGGIEIRATNQIEIKPSGDLSDYIEITTTGNIPKISTQGTCDLEIDCDGAEVRVPTADFHVDAGMIRADGDGTYVFEFPADATDPTGGGGAALGRVPCLIGGALRYLAYY